LYFSTHIVTGAALGTLTSEPALGFAAGVASHIVLDMIPHHDHRRRWVAALEITAGLLLLTLLGWRYGLTPVFWTALGAALPDVEVPLYYLGFIRRRVFPSHNGWTPHLKARLPFGIGVQVLICCVGLLVLAT